jgi:hypothetical protein
VVSRSKPSPGHVRGWLDLVDSEQVVAILARRWGDVGGDTEDKGVLRADVQAMSPRSI